MKFFKFLTLFSLGLFLISNPSFAANAKIAMIQYDADSHYGDYDFNMESLTRLAEDAAEEGAQLIIFPEGSTYGYASKTRLWCRPGMRTFLGKNCDDVSNVAENERDGKTTRYWEKFALNHQVTVIFSIMEKMNNEYFNTAVVVGPEGLIGSYQKKHLYIVDQGYATPGTDLLLLDLFGITFGVMICMDTNYSTLFQLYKNAGATAIIAPMDWDQSPDSSRGGIKFFRQQANRHAIDIYVADQSAWDSTGFYPASGAVRSRAPLAPVAVGSDGYSVVSIAE